MEPPNVNHYFTTTIFSFQVVKARIPIGLWYCTALGLYEIKYKRFGAYMHDVNHEASWKICKSNFRNWAIQGTGQTVPIREVAQIERY